jgi:osmoprotectant transport system permease protein
MNGRNRVIPVLTAAYTLAGLFGAFLSQAPNRLVSGTPVAIWSAVDWPILVLLVAFAALLIVVSQLDATLNRHRAMLVFATVLLLLLLDGAGRGAADLSRGATATSRVSLGWAFWLMTLCAIFAIVDAAQRMNLKPKMQLGLAGAFVAAIVAMTLIGRFDHLSLLREFATQRSAFFAELTAPWRRR